MPQLRFSIPLSLRPKSSCLHYSSNSFNLRLGYQTQLARLRTTETKQYVKQQIWLAAKFYVYVGTVGGLVALMVFGYENEVLERKYPSPSEWSWWTRFNYRTARGKENAEWNDTGLIDHAAVGERYLIAIRRCESVEVDGKDVRSLLGKDNNFYVDGSGRTGLDISAKSEQWRWGYYEALIGAARTAEHLDTWVRDKTRNIVFPPEMVVGPSNPRPKPVLDGTAVAPMEENCEPAFDLPQVYYMKIMTTHGFNTRQRIDAAIAYADWLDFKDLPVRAREMCGWALDIAADALHVELNDIMSTETGILKEHSTYITSNVLHAASALAKHYAQNKKFSTALPIFLSVLRAQRNLPPSSLSTMQPLSSSQKIGPSVIGRLVSIAGDILITPALHVPLASGDEPATRGSAMVCEEAAIMCDIGEILFISSETHSGTPLNTSPADASDSETVMTIISPSQSTGLAWTRSAVQTAEKALASVRCTDLPASETTLARSRCSECLLVGMSNWTSMVSTLQKAEALQHSPTGGLNICAHRKADSEVGCIRSNRVGSPNSKNCKEFGMFGDEKKWKREAQLVKLKEKEIAGLVRKLGT